MDANNLPHATQTPGAVPDFSGDQRRFDDEHTLGAPAEAVYSREILRRDLVIERGRVCARVTIPSLVPPLGYQEGDKLYTPHQGIGARGVNNISSRLLLTLFPPARPLFKHQIPPELAAEFEDEDPEVFGKIQVAFMKRALRVTDRTDSTPLRPSAFESLRLLMVAGNCLFKYETIDTPSVTQMDKYIVKRNPAGAPLMWIEQEMTSWQALSPDARSRIGPDHPKYLDIVTKPSWERVVPVYRVTKLVESNGKKKWLSWEEVCDQRIDETKDSHPFNAPPSYPFWMIPNYGYDWGRSYVDEYIGDLISVENYSKALNDGASAAALCLLFVRPGSRTRLDQVKSAKNLDVLSGTGEDLSMFRTDKQADFRIVLEILESIIQRLQFAFLLTSAIQRQGERVTAEEIKLMAQELDEAMGGIYAIFSQTIQGYIAHRAIYMMETTKELPPLPEAAADVTVKIITGLDALGESRESQLLDEYVEPFFAMGELGMRKINIDEYARRRAALKGIDPTGLIRSDDDLAREQQKAQQAQLMQTAIEKGVGPAVTAAAGAAQANPDAIRNLQQSNPQLAQGMDLSNIMSQLAPTQGGVPPQ